MIMSIDLQALVEQRGYEGALTFLKDLPLRELQALVTEQGFPLGVDGYDAEMLATIALSAYGYQDSQKVTESIISDKLLRFVEMDNLKDRVLGSRLSDPDIRDLIMSHSGDVSMQNNGRVLFHNSTPVDEHGTKLIASTWLGSVYVKEDADVDMIAHFAHEVTLKKIAKWRDSGDLKDLHKTPLCFVNPDLLLLLASVSRQPNLLDFDVIHDSRRANVQDSADVQVDVAKTLSDFKEGHTQVFSLDPVVVSQSDARLPIPQVLRDKPEVSYGTFGIVKEGYELRSSNGDEVDAFADLMDLKWWHYRLSNTREVFKGLGTKLKRDGKKDANGFCTMKWLTFLFNDFNKSTFPMEYLAARYKNLSHNDLLSLLALQLPIDPSAWKPTSNPLAFLLKMVASSYGSDVALPNITGKDLAEGLLQHLLFTSNSGSRSLLIRLMHVANNKGILGTWLLGWYNLTNLMSGVNGLVLGGFPKSKAGISDHLKELIADDESIADVLESWGYVTKYMVDAMSKNIYAFALVDDPDQDVKRAPAFVDLDSVDGKLETVAKPSGLTTLQAQQVFAQFVNELKALKSSPLFSKPAYLVERESVLGDLSSWSDGQIHDEKLAIMERNQATGKQTLDDLATLSWLTREADSREL